MIEAHPLYWPEGRPRTASWKRQRAKFRASFADSRDEALRQVKLLGGRLPILSTNVPLRLDGLPRAAAGEPADPAAALYFTRDGEQLVFACDKWDRVGANIRAIALTIEALRGISRWGSGDMLRSAFRGFVALPETAGQQRHWTEVLGLSLGAGETEIVDAYRRLSKLRHPDSPGGSHAAFVELTAARDVALKARRG